MSVHIIICVYAQPATYHDVLNSVVQTLQSGHNTLLLSTLWVTWQLTVSAHTTQMTSLLQYTPSVYTK